MNKRILFLALLVSTLASPAFAKTTAKAKPAAKECKLEITSNDKMQYNLKEMKVKAADCKTVTVTLKHVGKMSAQVMGHNWVLTTTADMQGVGEAAMKAGPGAGYLPKDKSKIISATDLIGGGKSTSTTFAIDKLKAGGDYSFFCSFPGHMMLMKGKFIVE
jgi:azurin